MFVVGRLALSLLCLGLVAAGAASAATPMKPADHHGYRWGPAKLLCTSVATERRANDKVAITFKGRRYWCSRPAWAIGTKTQAMNAVRLAEQEKINPGQGGLYDGFTILTCSGGPTVWRCQWQTPGFAGDATVTFTASGPKVVFA